MDDRRLEQTLRVIDRPDQPDPRFLAGLYEELAGDLGFRDGTSHVAASVPRTSTRDGSTPGSPRRATLRAAARGLHLPLAAALTGAAIAGALAGAFMLRPEPQPRVSLLDQVRDRGSLTVLVSEGRPQARSVRGAIGGFDVDVANLLASRLDLRGEILSIGDGLAELTTDWDVALPAQGLSDALTQRYAVSTPISWWPVHVLVPTGSPVEALEDLAGQPICVVAGSTGATWLTEPASVRSATPIVPPPTSADPRPLPDDDACLDALAAGTVRAAVTASIDPAGLATRGDVRAVGGPVLTEERGAVIDLSTGDPTALLAAIDAAIEAARDDGSLADLARSRFGGFDLSAPPTTIPEEP